MTPPQREEIVARMNKRMLHRGPDEGGLHSDGTCTLGMRRLAIFDPANGHQPMRTQDGRYTIVFNGAIYNFMALRRELEGHGHRFSTRCDTEVLLAAFAQWGEACVAYLRGMFAFAIWDSHRRRVTLMRDPLGIKPLYYACTADGLIWASEVEALFASGQCRREINPLAVVEYLRWFAIPAPFTLYKGISSLQPGEILRWEDGHLTTTGAWTLDRMPKLPPAGSAREATEQLRWVFRDTIRAHIAADVPVGAFLSGGIDSSLVVALMARETGTRLKTFSVGMDDPTYDESSEAEDSAAHIGTEHHTFRLTGQRVASDIDDLLASMDQPSGDGVNTYYAAQAAREGGVTVALSGLGSDELFGGYPSAHEVPAISGMLPKWRMIPGFLRSPIVALLRRGDTRKLKLADFLAYATNPCEVAALQRRVNAEPLVLDLLRADFRSTAGLGSPLHPRHTTIAKALVGRDARDIASAYELQGYMADVLLHDSDKMSMRHSLELRTPFVDVPLLNWVWSQKPDTKHGFTRPKGLLVEAFKDLLPPATVARRKRGFSLPFDRWLRCELKEFMNDTFQPDMIKRCPVLDPVEVRGRWTSFLSRQDPREWSRLWSLAVLIRHCNRKDVS